MTAIQPVSVPHTGTRTLEQFLETLPIVFRNFIHVYDNDIIYITQLKNKRFIIPVSDPLRCWTSHWLEKKKGINIDHVAAIENLTRMVCSWYGNLGIIEEEFPHVHFRIDGPIEERAAEEKKVMDFLGVEKPIKPFKWRVVGGSPGEMKKPYMLWNKTKKTLKTEIAEYILNELKPYRDRYGYV